MNERFAGLLGMAKRAGKVQIGFDETVGQVRKQKAHLVLLANDLSPKSEKEYVYILQCYTVEYFVYFVILSLNFKHF